MNAPIPLPLEHPWAEPPAPGESIGITGRVAWIRMPLPFALDHINLWLLREADDRWTAIDCGYGDAPTRALWERHFATTMGGAPITTVIATHYHPDHLGNATWLARRFDAPIRMTQSEFLIAHAIHDQRATHAVADTCALFAAHGLARDAVDALLARGNAYARGVPDVPATFSRMLAGDRIDAGGHRWTVIPGHGHSPEHASLHAGDAGLLVSGDMLLPRISTNVSVWPADPLGDPLGRFLDSLAAFEALPPQTLVLPSHGLPFRGIATRVAALRAHHDARLGELADALGASRAPLSAADLVPVLFRRALDLQQRFFAMGEAIAHLNYLVHRGRIERLVATDGTVRFVH